MSNGDPLPSDVMADEEGPVRDRRRRSERNGEKATLAYGRRDDSLRTRAVGFVELVDSHGGPLRRGRVVTLRAYFYTTTTERK